MILFVHKEIENCLSKIILYSLLTVQDINFKTHFSFVYLLWTKVSVCAWSSLCSPGNLWIHLSLPSSARLTGTCTRTPSQFYIWHFLDLNYSSPSAPTQFCLYFYTAVLQTGWFSKDAGIIPVAIAILLSSRTAHKYLARNLGTVLWSSNFFISSHNQVLAFENFRQEMKIYLSMVQLEAVLLGCFLDVDWLSITWIDCNARRLWVKVSTLCFRGLGSVVGGPVPCTNVPISAGWEQGIFPVFLVH